MVVEIKQRAVIIDATDPQNAKIQTKLGNKIQCGFACYAAVFITDFSPRQNDAEIRLTH
ncbi:Uncharacterised protein [Vibrio cholerae]|nr:Uncharacterised protein [Vibrio cholerae]CSB35474.1 Uncharacterised protein [Vibrio cholerae]